MTRDHNFAARSPWSIFAVLAGVMLLTRTHPLSMTLHLIDTSWASFFVAGWFIRTPRAFAALFGLAFAIDLVMIRLLGTSDFCFTSAYWMLLPAYGVMWLAGRWARQHLAPTLTSLPMLFMLVSLASLGAELLSSGGFYFLSGRFAEPNLTGFLPRLAQYFPYTLADTLGWTGVAAALYALMAALFASSAPHKR